MGATAAEAAVEHYNEHGYAVVEGIFDDAEMAALGDLVSSLLAHEIAAIEDAGVSLGPGRHGPTPRTTVELDSAGNIAWQLNRPLWEHAEVHGDASTPSPFRTKALDPRITAVASALLGSPCMVFQDQAFLKPPAQGGQRAYHQDNWYFGLTSSDKILTAWIALDDAGNPPPPASPPLCCLHATS